MDPGLRNMTSQGLTGTLGNPNDNLTRRPSAGAYVSLDPATGPDASYAHISQNSNVPKRYYVWNRLYRNES